MMGEVITPVAMKRDGQWPCQTYLADPVVEPSVPERAVVRGLVHQHAERVHPASNPEQRDCVDHHVPVGLAEPHGCRVQKPLEHGAADKLSLIDARQRLQNLRWQPGGQQSRILVSAALGCVAKDIDHKPRFAYGLRHTSRSLQPR